MKRISKNTWLLFKRRQRQLNFILVSLGLQLSGFVPRLLGQARAIVDRSRQLDGKIARCRHENRTPCERIKLNFQRPLLLPRGWSGGPKLSGQFVVSDVPIPRRWSSTSADEMEKLQFSAGTSATLGAVSSVLVLLPHSRGTCCLATDRVSV